MRQSGTEKPEQSCRSWSRLYEARHEIDTRQIADYFAFTARNFDRFIRSHDRHLNKLSSCSPPLKHIISYLAGLLRGNVDIPIYRQQTFELFRIKTEKHDIFVFS